jgi:hypothetical protein
MRTTTKLIGVIALLAITLISCGDSGSSHTHEWKALETN